MKEFFAWVNAINKTEYSIHSGWKSTKKVSYATFLRSFANTVPWFQHWKSLLDFDWIWRYTRLHFRIFWQVRVKGSGEDRDKNFPPAFLSEFHQDGFCFNGCYAKNEFFFYNLSGTYEELWCGEVRLVWWIPSTFPIDVSVFEGDPRDMSGRETLDGCGCLSG